MSVNSASSESQFNINATNSNGESVYEFEGFRLDARRLMLYSNGHEIDLAPKVVETLLALVENAGRIVSKEELFERLWKGSFVDESNLTQNIYLLRKTLGNASDGRPMIETFRRRGYRFNSAPGTEKASLSIGDKETSRGGESRTRSKRAVAIWFAAAAIIPIVFVGWYLFSIRRPTESRIAGPPRSISFQRLTPYQAIFSPSISADGKLLAYCLVEPTGPSLWIKELASGSTRQLLPSINKGFRHLRFSPDGSDIYFLNQNNQLAAVPAAGGAVRILLNDVVNPFAVSPDGKDVVFVRARALVIARLDGSSERVLSERDGEAKWYSSLTAHPSWSPDGSRIVISGGRLEGGRKYSELIGISVEAGTEQLIATPQWESINNVAWLKNGSGLFVTARERLIAPAQIWIVAYPEGSVARVTNDLQSYGQLSVSSDSLLLVTEKIVGACNLWSGSLDNPDHLTQLTFDDSEVSGRSGLSLSAEGKVVFAAEYSGNMDLWRINMDGTELRQMTANSGDWNGRHQLSPDGSFIAFVSRREGSHRSVWRMDADGGNPRQITPGGQDYPAVSPDGKWIYYTELLGKRPAIYRVPSVGGDPEPVTGAYPASMPSISPDGTRLAFISPVGEAADTGKIGLLRLGTNSQPETFQIDAFRGILRWERGGEALIYIQRGSPNLWRLPVNGGMASQITDLRLETTWNFALSPNAEKFVLSRGDTSAEAVLISNFR